MSKVVEISACIDCPHVESNWIMGGTTKGVYYFCRKEGKKEITNSMDILSTQMPTWCPLPDKNGQNEKS